MRKIFFASLLLILFSNITFAMSQQEAVNKHLSGRKLDTLEGIWSITQTNQLVLFFKSGNTYQFYDLSYPRYDPGVFQKSTDSYYYGTGAAFYNYNFTNPKFGNQTIAINGNYGSIVLTIAGQSPINWTMRRIWPEKLDAYNSQFESIASKPPAGSTKDRSSEKPKRGGSGSAFFINNKGNIITNNHVVEVCSGNIKIIHNKKEITASIIAKDEKLDLVVLSSNIKPQQFIKLSKKSGEKLDKVVTAGYPLGYKISDELKFTSGIVSATKGWKDNINEFQIDAALNPGNSGGPVVNDAGNLFGVAVAGLADRQNLNFAIKSKAVKDFLDVNKVSYSTASVEFDMDNKKRLKLLEDSTVFIYCN